MGAPQPHQSAPSRRRLLDAGLAMLTEPSLEMTIRGVTADRLCKRAGLARRTFYDQFETTEEFVNELRKYVAERIEALNPPEPISLDDTAGDLHDAASIGFDRVCTYLTTSEALRTGARRLGDEPPVPAAEGLWNLLIDELMSLGLRPGSLDREPLAAALTDLARGFAIGVGGDRSHAVGAIEQLLGQLVDPLDETIDRPDTLRRTRVQLAWAESQAPLTLPNVRLMITEAAEQLIDSNGARRLSVEAIAHATGLSRTAVIRHVGGPDAIIAAIVDDLAAALEVRLDQDRRSGLTDRERLERHIERLVELNQRRPGAHAALRAMAEIDGLGASRSLSVNKARLDETVCGLLGVDRPAAGALLQSIDALSATTPADSMLQLIGCLNYPAHSLLTQTTPTMCRTDQPSADGTTPGKPCT